jgi:hypothetical protein
MKLCAETNNVAIANTAVKINFFIFLYFFILLMNTNVYKKSQHLAGFFELI